MVYCEAVFCSPAVPLPTRPRCHYFLYPPCPQYNPSTIDINTDATEMSYWIGILQARSRIQRWKRRGATQRKVTKHSPA